MMISIQYFWSSSCVLPNAMEQLLSFITTVAFNDGYSNLLSQGLTVSLFNYRANQIDVIRHDVSSSFPQVPLHMDGTLLTVF